MSDKEGLNILVMVCGSVAAIKVPILLNELRTMAEECGRSPHVRVVVTEPALHFFDWKELSKSYTLYRDCDEWNHWNQMGDPVLHIDLRKWADVGLIAPIDANTSAKIAVGMCDNLLTCVVRAWDMNKPLLFCPAMNVHMWDHPITESNMKTISSYGYIQIGPISKRLACGDTGMGAMAEVNDIVDNVRNVIKSRR